MENNVQKKARLILAGLAALPAIGNATTNQAIQTNAYCSPYQDACHTAPVADEGVSGLTAEEEKQAKDLVAELNQLDVISVQEMNITKAPRIPYNYNLPSPTELAAAKEKNLERLEKLKRIIEAAK